MNNYVQQNLGKDEKLILTVNPHWITLLPHIPLILIYGLGLITMIPAVVRLLTTVVAFTDKKVMCKTGLINTRKMDSPLNQVNNVTVTSGLFGKIIAILLQSRLIKILRQYPPPFSYVSIHVDLFAKNFL